MRCKHISKFENTHWYRIALIHEEKKSEAAAAWEVSEAEAQSNTIVCFHFPSKAKFNGMFTVDLYRGIACFVFFFTLSLRLPSVSFSLSITPLRHIPGAMSIQLYRNKLLCIDFLSWFFFCIYLRHQSKRIFWLCHYRISCLQCNYGLPQHTRNCSTLAFTLLLFPLCTILVLPIISVLFQLPFISVDKFTRYANALITFSSHEREKL